jgi:chromosome partitioning protein
LAYVAAIVNQKGGVGKTTTAVNLGSALGLLGARVLLVDSDPQSNASRSLTEGRNPSLSVYDALSGRARTSEAIVATAAGGGRLWLLPATPALAGAEVELVSTQRREYRLGDALQGVAGDYDIVLIDCPPSLGLLSVNALVAANGVIVPVQCEYLSLEGIGLLSRTLGLVRTRLNPELVLLGVVLTMFDPRTRLSSEVVSEVRRHFPAEATDTVIPRSIRLGEAPSFGQPIDAYAPGSRGDVAYRQLAFEIAARVGVKLAANGSAVAVPA